LSKDWCATQVAHELVIATATATTSRCKPLIAMIHKVCKNFTRVHVFGDSAFRNSNVEIFSAATMEVLALAMHAIAGATVWVITESQKRRSIAVSNQPDIATFATVPTIGPTKGHGTFTAEADTACATVSTADI
jgi:hypothetical protein